MKIVALVGSLREQSYNRRLVETWKERYRDRFGLEVLDIAALPYYNQDQELEPPEVVRHFKQQVKEADAVFIVTPEYNWSVSGVLKNALDWLSRVDKVLQNKPVLTAGVSTGVIGTVRAQIDLRKILSSPGLSARVFPPGGNEILVNFAPDKFRDGRLVDGPTLEFIDQVMERFLAWCEKEKGA